MSLEGKVALITGGSSGIGRAAALEFARRRAKVVIAARRTEQGETTAHEIVTSGAEALFVKADMSRSGEISSMVEQTVKAFGRLDCAVNNAAIEGFPLRLLAEVDETTFDEVMAVNVKGVWLCMKHEIRQMLNQIDPGGSIVNVSSVNGLGGTRGAAPYAASKAAVIGLTKSAAIEYATMGIRVNVLVPGAFQTPMLDRAKEQIGGDPAAAEAAYRDRIPLQRIGDPDEAAQAIAWLCSDEASYVTGHSMIVDGGLTSSMR